MQISTLIPIPLPFIHSELDPLSNTKNLLKINSQFDHVRHSSPDYINRIWEIFWQRFRN